MILLIALLLTSSQSVTIPIAQSTNAMNVKFAVTSTGEVKDCRVTKSSGKQELDARTCKLVEQCYVLKSRSLDPDCSERVSAAWKDQDAAD